MIQTNIYILVLSIECNFLREKRLLSNLQDVLVKSTAAQVKTKCHAISLHEAPLQLVLYS